jgi:hypothetical protein
MTEMTKKDLICNITVVAGYLVCLFERAIIVDKETTRKLIAKWKRVAQKEEWKSKGSVDYVSLWDLDQNHLHNILNLTKKRYEQHKDIYHEWHKLNADYFKRQADYWERVKKTDGWRGEDYFYKDHFSLE